MLAIFCLRLACGLIAALLLLSGSQVNPRFYRTHFLTALGLAATAAIFSERTDDAGQWWALGVSLTLALLGSVAWMLEGAPLGRTLIFLTTAALVAALGLQEASARGAVPANTSSSGAPNLAWLLVDDYSSAALLGAATTAMLIGHSYLIAPAMSLMPLMRLLGTLFVCLAARMAVAVIGLWYWTADYALVNLETTLWLVPRWGLGFAGPLALGWMAWETARIRSTQSATGILYVVVIFCFLGELISQLLLLKNGLPM